MAKPIKITALSPEELAKLLAQASRKDLSAADVGAIAETGGIVAADGTINLIDYTAFLVQELSRGPD